MVCASPQIADLRCDGAAAEISYYFNDEIYEKRQKMLRSALFFTKKCFFSSVLRKFPPESAFSVEKRFILADVDFPLALRGFTLVPKRDIITA